MAEGDVPQSEQALSTLPLKTGVDQAPLPTTGDVYNVGDRVLCTATFDNEPHPAEVVERRVEGEELLYYVHYLDRDKRLDEWVPARKVCSPLNGWASGDVCSPRFSTGNGACDIYIQGPGDAKPYTTRTMKRRYEEIHHVGPGVEELPPIDQQFEKQHQQRTKVKNIRVIELGKHEIDTWYYSPYPEPYGSIEKLFFCEYDLKYFRKKTTLLKHLAKTKQRQPPGMEIYRSRLPSASSPEYASGAVVNPPISVFEVDGAKHKLYCQNLCLLSKLFLDHKTLYYDVEPFLFYVLFERELDDQAGSHHIVGYFSKEKNSVEGYNVACILTLPPYQKRGYGRFLIAFSYELSKREGKVGTPERPLSDLGLVSYKAYWMKVIFDFLKEYKGEPSIKDISECTAIRHEDIIKTLDPLGLIKYYRGDHLLVVTPRIVEEHWKNLPVKRCIGINPAWLTWVPYAPPAQQLKMAQSLKR